MSGSEIEKTVREMMIIIEINNPDFSPKDCAEAAIIKVKKNFTGWELQRAIDVVKFQYPSLDRGKR